MKLRRFTSAGVEMARQYLAAVKESNDVENVTLNGQPFTRAALISSPAYSDAIPALADIDLDETRTFDTTFAFCEYFDSLIHDHNPQAYREDVDFWTWLAMVYLPQLVKVKSGKVVTGAEARLVYSVSSHLLRHRHLFCYPFYLYNNYRTTPDICKVVLWHNLNTYNDLVEQILSRQFVVQNPALLKAANTLYFDLNVGKAKPGAAGDGAGGVRRFIVLVDQLARTRDFFDMEDYEVFIQMLPKEFERFKRLRV